MKEFPSSAATAEALLRGWAKAYRDTPEHRFPSDPHAEFFPVDLEYAADEIKRLSGIAQAAPAPDTWHRELIDREPDHGQYGKAAPPPASIAEAEDLLKANQLLHGLLSNRDAEIKRLRDPAYTAKEPFNEALRTFFSWAMRNGSWDGCGLDGADLQDKAEHLGLIVKTKFDPSRHQGSSEFEEGDDFYEFAPGLMVPSTSGGSAA